MDTAVELMGKLVEDNLLPLSGLISILSCLSTRFVGVSVPCSGYETRCLLSYVRPFDLRHT